MYCPCKDCITVPICRREPPGDVVNKCELVKRYLGINVSFKVESLCSDTSKLKGDKMVRRLKVIVKCLGLEHTDGHYIGAPSEEEK
jgi:hypothetical protein